MIDADFLKKLVVAAATVVGVVVPILAQEATDWQTKAGGKMAFEVASIKPGSGAFSPSNMPLTPWDDYDGTDGRFIADSTLSGYIQFAYKIWPNDVQSRELSHLPKWADTDHYSIEARATTGHVTKDQMRLMMQSLLADRFHLAVHFENRELPVFELRLAKAGKPGPKLVSHADGPPCDQPGRPPHEGLPGFPGNCRTLSAIDVPGNIPSTRLVMIGERDASMDMIAGAFSMVPMGLDRPILDKTGLTGRFDFTLEWARPPKAAAVSDSPVPADPVGPSPLEALEEQLDLKVEATKASIPILVIDRVERPSEN